MSKMQRTKGATFEREVCHLLSQHFGVKIERKIGQARDGGNDIDAGRFVVECKRRASLTTLRRWLQQAEAAIAPDLGVSEGLPRRLPLVVMREDGPDSPMVLLALPDFLELVGTKL